MSLHRDLRSRVFDIAEIALGEFDGGRPDVLLQAMQLRRAWNWDDPGLLSKQPRECDLGGVAFFLEQSGRADRPGPGSPCGPPALKRGMVLRKSRAVECGVLVDLAGEKALAQRAEGNEADPELFEGRHDLCFRAPSTRASTRSGGR